LRAFGLSFVSEIPHFAVGREAGSYLCMKVIKPSVDILDQQGPGFEGMLRHIEKVGRISYLSYDKMTEDSYHKFVNMLIKIGHWSCLSCGTVYLNIPRYDIELIGKLMSIKTLRKFGPFIRWYETGEGDFHVTTDYRICKKLKIDDEVIQRYWREPTEDFYHRVTSHWICSRACSHQVVRHRAFCFNQESQRHINYKEGLTFILPQWAYTIREKIATTCKWPENEVRSWVRDEDGEKLWGTLICEDRTAAGRDELWRRVEDEYQFEVTSEESERLKPQDARGCMCEDCKTEFYMVGFVEDYFHTPEEDSTEKEGFFYLRTDKAAQDEVRVLATELKRLFTEAGIDKLK